MEQKYDLGAIQDTIIQRLIENQNWDEKKVEVNTEDIDSTINYYIEGWINQTSFSTLNLNEILDLIETSLAKKHGKGDA